MSSVWTETGGATGSWAKFEWHYYKPAFEEWQRHSVASMPIPHLLKVVPFRAAIQEKDKTLSLIPYPPQTWDGDFKVVARGPMRLQPNV